MIYRSGLCIYDSPEANIYPKEFHQLIKYYQ